MPELVDTRQMHPKHGPHQPHTGTPPRRPGSMRRTTTHTVYHPDGLIGPVQVEGAGRDLWTGPDGATEVVATARTDAGIDFIGSRALTSLTVTPEVDVTALIGVRVSGGFRRALDAAFPGEDRIASLRYQLLDEMALAGVLAGFPISAAGMHPRRGAMDLSHMADICAGWATGATILSEIEELGHVPPVTGPVAPDVEAPGADGDPLGWHEHGPMEPHGMCRRRRIDVWQPEPGGPVQVEEFFRDSHMSGDGLESVVHEYMVRAELEPAGFVFLSCQAEVGVLPWMECPGALASAARVVGIPAGDMRQHVRESLVGTSTCTHLNDALRALAALPFLARGVVAGKPN